MTDIRTQLGTPVHSTQDVAETPVTPQATPAQQLHRPDLESGGVRTNAMVTQHGARVADSVGLRQNPTQSMFDQLEQLINSADYIKPPPGANFIINDPNLGDPNAKVGITVDQGATAMADRAAFEALATRDDVPGAPGVREVKFLITDVDTDEPKVYFLNTNNVPYHYLFARDVLGSSLSNREFNSQTYFSDSRKFIAGTLVAYDNVENEDGSKGLYGLEFWPTDPVRVDHVQTANELISKAMPFAGDHLRYHPAGETQLERYEREKADFDAAGINPVTTEELLGNATFTPLNLGVSYGRLRVYDANDPTPPTARDVVIFESIPNDLSHVAGVITEDPQTPLSHVNLKAKQNHTPNAYLRNASERDDIKDLIGEWVRYEVTPDGVQIVAATQQEVDEHFESLRPTTETVLRPNRGETRVQSLADLGFHDADAYGAKAANVAELGQLLGSAAVPEGFGVPFAAYDKFMRESGLYDEARAMMADADFQSDPAVREQRLNDFRRRIRRADVPADLSAQLQEAYETFVHQAVEDHLFFAVLSDKLPDVDAVLDTISESMHFEDAADPEAAMREWATEARVVLTSSEFRADPEGTVVRLLVDQAAQGAKMLEGPRLVPSMRGRSSTNNEDLAGFNGAGLYDSYTHRPDEGRFENTAKQVWSSLWNFRAFEERDFFRIDHFSAAMGILVHPNFSDEQANGVAVTKNIYDAKWEGFYINAQVGEELVTNPEGGLTPDELLVAAVGENLEWETQYIRRSNATEDGATVLTEAQIAELTQMMQRIQRHFRRLYQRHNDETFAMDIEFKVHEDGRLMVKQSRPWID